MADYTATTDSLIAQINLGEAYKLRVDGPPVAEVYGTPADLINALLPNIYVFAGILLFVFIFAAGFKMVMNPSDKKSAEEGKKAFFYAIGGFILLIASFWIMQIIGVLTGVDVLGGL